MSEIGRSSSSLSGASVLVTGASGFVGQHLIAALRRAGADVHCYSRSDGAVARVVEKNRPHHVFHLAASRARSGSLDAFDAALEQNIQATLGLIGACITVGTVRSFVTVGTCDEYGACDAPFTEAMREKPSTAYGWSKASITNLLLSMFQAQAFPAVVLRASVVYGPGQGADMFLPALIGALSAGRHFPMSAGEQTRDFLFVGDLVEAMMLAATAPVAVGEIINVAGGFPTRLLDAAFLVADLIGPNARSLLGVGSVAYRANEQMSYWADIAKANRILGWTPRTHLADGLAATVLAQRGSEH